jgi:hypothetical protein
MTKEIVIHGQAFDQTLPISEYDIEEAYAEVDDILDRCKEANSPDEGIELGKQYIRGIQMKGVALAKLMHGLREQWAGYGLGEAFVDRIVAEWGFHKGTVNQYLNVMDNVLANDDIPAETRNVLAEKSMPILKRLSRPGREKALKDEEWEEVSKLTDLVSVKKYVDDKMGKSSRGRPVQMTISMYPDGSVIAFEGSRRVNLGVLRVSEEDLKDDLRKRAINGLIESGGIIRM